MPELPEVENVKIGLEALGSVGQRFDSVELRARALRTPLSRKLHTQLPGQSIRSVGRRAKFLLFETDDYFVVNHLGMTGSWRPRGGPADLIKHDHVFFRFHSGLELVFNDPRRFGLMEIVEKKHLASHGWLKHLGPEPLADAFSGPYLFQGTRGLSTSIKNYLMDQKKVVGVGNIYASEALFTAGVRPARPAGRITKSEAQAIASAVKTILTTAIAKGGATIRDYKNTNGQSGRYQNEFFVYGRADANCRRCSQPIRSRMMSGRNTFWCATCQA